MKNYILTVKHDNGTIKIKTAAKDKIHAAWLIMEAESCPFCAITNIKEY